MKPETEQEIDQAIDEYATEVIGILTAYAVASYMAGMLSANYFVKDHQVSIAQMDADAHMLADDYHRMLVERGGTMIDETFKPWLSDTKIDLRQQIKTLINNELEKGVPVDVITAELATMLSLRESDALRIASNEIITLRDRGMDALYRRANVRYVTCVFGPNPCPQCIPHIGRVYRIEEAPYLPRHVHCREYYIPVYR